MPTTTQILSKFFLHALLQLQEVLRTLHSHLGAQVPAEASAALGVLVALARQHTAQLMRYAAFLTNILDYIDGYTDQQVHQARAGEGLGWAGGALRSGWQAVMVGHDILAFVCVRVCLTATELATQT